MVDLGGIRVLELGELVSAPYAARLLADLGAEVIKVEPPGGDRARRRGPFRADPHPDASGLFLALNTDKTNIVADPDDPSPVLDLVDQADIVISNFVPSRLADLGLDLGAMAKRRPSLVVCSITAFGLTGRRSHYAAEELTVAHGGGWAYQCPGASDDPSLPPLKVFGHQTDFHGGLTAAMASLAAFGRAERTGRGELIDLSTVANTAAMLEGAVIAASYLGESPSRLGHRLLNPWGIFPCRDGLLFLVTVEQDQWERLVGLMGSPEWADSGLFDTNELRFENADLLHLYLQEWTSGFAMDELWRLGQAERICFAPVLTMADLHHQEHLRERHFFAEVDHPAAGVVSHLGRPFRWDGAPPPRPQPAPLLAHAQASDRVRFQPRPDGPDPGRSSEGAGAERPLEGVRVLDLTWVWAGPYATLHLAYLGAEVIKIESSTRPGLGRRLPFHPPDVEPSLNTSAYFNQWDQAKLSCELDLADPDDLGRLKELVRCCDVVVENFATGVMDRLGLDYETLRSLNPGIIVASISGYGSSGPLRSYMGYGPTTGPLSGLTALTGHPGGPPEELGISFGDPAAGMTAAFAICAALIDRGRTGDGAYLDVALWEATASNAVEGWMAHALGGAPPEPMGNRDTEMAPHGCYRSAPDPGADDDPEGPGWWVTIACTDDQRWATLAEVIDPDLVADPRFRTAEDRRYNEDELDAIVAAWTGERDRWSITEQLQALGIAAYPSMSPFDLLADGHLEDRGLFQQLDHPEVGRRRHTGPPWLLARSPNGVTRPAPLLGQHTDYVLGLVADARPTAAD